MVETSECYEGRGKGYRGTVDVTPTGLTCQRWDSQYPHNHTFTPQAYTCKWVASARAHTCAVTAGPPLTSCVFQRPERELLSESRWPRVPLVLHHRPEDPDDALHQHPPVRHPKQSQRWASQQPHLTLVTGEKPILHLQRGENSPCVYVCGGKKIQKMRFIVWRRPGVSASVEICNPAGLWEGASAASHPNEFWQQRRTVRGGKKRCGRSQCASGLAGAFFKAKDVRPRLSARMQSSLEIRRRHVFLSVWRRLWRLRKLPEAVWVFQE